MPVTLWRYYRIDEIKMKVERNFLKVGNNFLPPTHPIFSPGVREGCILQQKFPTYIFLLHDPALHVPCTK
jgi:hypothetical protein